MKIALIIAGYAATVFLVYYLLCFFFNADGDDMFHFALIALAWPAALAVCIVILALFGPFYGIYMAAGATRRWLDERAKK